MADRKVVDNENGRLKKSAIFLAPKSRCLGQNALEAR